MIIIITKIKVQLLRSIVIYVHLIFRPSKHLIQNKIIKEILITTTSIIMEVDKVQVMEVEQIVIVIRTR